MVAACNSGLLPVDFPYGFFHKLTNRIVKTHRCMGHFVKTFSLNNVPLPNNELIRKDISYLTWFAWNPKFCMQYHFMRNINYMNIECLPWIDNLSDSHSLKQKIIKKLVSIKDKILTDKMFQNLSTLWAQTFFWVSRILFHKFMLLIILKCLAGLKINICLPLPGWEFLKHT